MVTAAKTRYEVGVDRNLCTGCSGCARVCPVGVFDMVSNKAVPTREEMCMGCQLCEVECPVKAITVSRPLVAAPTGPASTPATWTASRRGEAKAPPELVGVGASGTPDNVRWEASLSRPPEAKTPTPEATPTPTAFHWETARREEVKVSPPATKEAAPSIVSATVSTWPGQPSSISQVSPVSSVSASPSATEWPAATVSVAPSPPLPLAAPSSPAVAVTSVNPIGKKLWVVKDLCNGCRICEVMCSLKHNGTGNPYRARLKIALPPGNAFNYTPIICHHCKNPPPCMQACPVGAFYIDPVTDAAFIDASKCISCMACVHACPFGAIQVGPDQREILKCDLCGGDPVCVKYCAPRPENLHPRRSYPKTSILRYDEPHHIAELTRQLQISKA